MKKPDVEGFPYEPLSVFYRNEEGQICSLNPTEAAEAYSGMIDVLIKIRETYRDPFRGGMIISKRLWREIEDKLRKAGVTDL